MALHLLLIRWQTIEKVVTDPISKETTENCLFILKVFELRAFMKLMSYPLWSPGPSAPLVMGSLCPHPPSPAPLGRPESVRPSPTYLTHPSPLLKLIFATNCSSLVLHCLDCHCYTSFPIGAPMQFSEDLPPPSVRERLSRRSARSVARPLRPPAYIKSKPVDLSNGLTV